MSTEADSGSTVDGPRKRSTRTVQAVEHAIDVLEVLAAAGAPIGVSDIARETNLSKATVHHLLSTLANRRFVMREPHSTLYGLGWNLHELGSMVVQNADVSRVARPYLDTLAGLTKSAVLVAILDEDSVLYLVRGEAPGVLRTLADAGRRSPLHATASGKVLLAFAEPRYVDRLLRKELAQLTPSTHTDPEALRQELDGVRQKGFSTCWQEREVGLSSIAVPLRNHTGAVIACLTVAANSARLGESTLEDYLAPLRRTATQIERQLGASHDQAS